MYIVWRRNFGLRFTRDPITQKMFEPVPYRNRTV